MGGRAMTVNSVYIPAVGLLSFLDFEDVLGVQEGILHLHMPGHDRGSV